jgi:hypothetical protein
MKIQEYRTATGDSLKQLDAEVNEYIKGGFQPFGNPYHLAPQEGVVDAPICQAMVKEFKAAKSEMANPVMIGTPR